MSAVEVPVAKVQGSPLTEAALAKVPRALKLELIALMEERVRRIEAQLSRERDTRDPKV